jgi:1-acyl-sn-glycerol-3-phosphate acyltransferase
MDKKMAVERIDRQHSSIYTYNHADWSTRRRLLRFLLRTIGFTLLAKVDQVDGLENFPQDGPAILMINHIAFIDPIVILHVVPRNIVPLAKIEVYNYPVVGIFPRLWGVIPVRREEFDRRAVQQVLQVLKAGEIVLVAPEGTRSPQLSQGKEGIAYLASRSGAPVIPVAVDGTIGYPAFRLSERWKGPGAHITFGKPFHFHSQARQPGKEELRKMTDEAMYILAGMLPEHRRGVYADLTQATRDTIVWT